VLSSDEPYWNFICKIFLIGTQFEILDLEPVAGVKPFAFLPENKGSSFNGTSVFKSTLFLSFLKINKRSIHDCRRGKLFILNHNINSIKHHPA
jgi:hypothetical protein